MSIKYDMDKILKDLKKQVLEEKKKQREEKENNPIESPEDAPETKQVAPATSKTSEDFHGGDEATGEIEDSPNSINDGKNSKKKNKTEKTKGNGENNIEKTNNNEINEEKYQEDEIKEGKTNNNFMERGEGGYDENKHKSSPQDLEKIVEKLFEEKKQSQQDFKTKNRQEYLKKYILEVIKKIAAQHAGCDKQDGSESYDKKQMLEHIMRYQTYKILNDKYDLKDARYVQFFIDTSGVYGSGSNRVMQEVMPEIIGILEKQGYECYIAACGNGFGTVDLVDNEYYGTRKTLEEYRAGKVNKIACPTPETAAKMANNAEFSIILADFDGLTSICKMANLCQKDKIPYFLCTEDRYPWEDPTLHDWVDPDEDYNYNLELVYDVSIEGNPNIQQYEQNLYDFYNNDQEYYEYEDDEYEDDEYEDDEYEDNNYEYDD